jgi:hypothetical protein
MGSGAPFIQKSVGRSGASLGACFLVFGKAGARRFVGTRLGPGRQLLTAWAAAHCGGSVKRTPPGVGMVEPDAGSLDEAGASATGG